MDTLHVLTAVTAFAAGGAAISGLAALRATRLTARLSKLLSVEETNEDLRERIETAYERLEVAQRQRFEAASERDAYRETLVEMGAENEALRKEMAELREERDLVETELMAAKLALEAEERQADTWARTAATLGFTANGPAVAALGAAA